jgi:hypothetical protein
VNKIGRSSNTRGGTGGTPTAQLGLFLLLFILCLITYHGISDNFFFNDDFLWLRDARHEMNGGNVWSFRVINFFRPLVNLSFYLSERVSPGDIVLYHWFNLLLHFFNCILVYLLIRNVLRDTTVAAVAAVLFAVTSVHNGAVFWISARTTLLSTACLLGSLVLLTRRPRINLIVPLLLYILALAAKETAVVGCALALLLFAFRRNSRANRAMSGDSVFSFTAATIIYFVMRAALMGQFFQDNWEPGFHVLRNLAGGFLYQLYPWPLFSFVFHSAGHFLDPQHLLWPEIAVVPLVLLLLLLGMRTNQFKALALAIGWSFISLLPASLYTYRFFSTASMTQNRYYYLSSAGTVLIIALVLAALWRTRRGAAQIAAAAALAVCCAGYMARVDALEKRWDAFTHSYQRVVSIVIDEVRKAPSISSIAIEDAPMEFKYLEAALGYLHPEWSVHQAAGGRESAARWAPCLYIRFEIEPGMLNVTSTMVE